MWLGIAYERIGEVDVAIQYYEKATKELVSDLRPWVLDASYSSAQVPHLKDLIAVPQPDAGDDDPSAQVFTGGGAVSAGTSQSGALEAFGWPSERLFFLFFRCGRT